MKEFNEYWCRFVIDTQEMRPAIVTEMTGIGYTTLLIKGSPHITPATRKVTPHKINEYNLWTYETAKETNVSGLHIEKNIVDFLTVLDARKEVVKNVLAVYLKHVLSIYGHTADFHIYFSLSNSTLQRLNAYGLQVEFDIYSLREQEKG